MIVVLFEDDRVTQLYPATIGRGAMALGCGGYSWLELAPRLASEVRLLVRPHLQAVLAADGWQVGFDGLASGVPILFLNGRLVPSASVLAQVAKVLAAGDPVIVRQGSSIALALLRPARPLPALPSAPQDWNFFLDACGLPALDLDLPLLEYPHDIVRHHMATIGANLDDRLRRGKYTQQAEGVYLAEGASLGSFVVTDTTRGPIVLERNASVGPYTLLSGPTWLGAQARVLEHAALKDGVAIGHTTKIGGEVEGSVVEPYTNKQHHGFLGHSYLGSWVNLGAGTCNSDLKNTYGQVNMEYHGQKVPTGMQFFGCVVGDYAKTAINTGIFTGKTIGACSMIYGFVTTNVPSFTNYARSFGQVTEAPVEVLVATQARMFARRQVAQRPCDVQLLYDMYHLTAHERQLAGEPLAL